MKKFEYEVIKKFGKKSVGAKGVASEDVVDNLVMKKLVKKGKEVLPPKR